ncbi:MAG: hypothetical protein COB02_17900 [Candidatus Cloacimonadota bacterium]|nr:MAG: hypothetical protein COB02_17900 [Candidatus Cloacimonadota bacterium]
MSENFMIYCDMDGVLTDFNKALITYYNTDFLKSFPNFPKTDINSASNLHKLLGNRWYTVTESAPLEYWRDMAWMPDGKILWDFIKKLDTMILSTPAQTDHCKQGKREWVSNHLGDDLDVILAYDKESYVENDKYVPKHCLKRRRILIDDMQKKIDKWQDAGGIAILHTSAKTTIKKLKELMYHS